VRIIRRHPDSTVTAEIHISMGRKGRDYRRRHRGPAEEMYAIEKDVKAALGKKSRQIITFGRLCEEFRTWAEPQKSFERHKKYLIEAIKNEFGHLPVCEFPPLLLDQYKARKQSEGKSPATVNRYLSLVHVMFTKAAEWGFADEEISKRVHKIKLLKGEAKRTRFLLEPEADKLLAVCPAHLKPIVAIAIHTGMRKSEILSLTWGQVDTKNGYITLHETKNSEGRQVPINQTVRKTLKSIPRHIMNPHIFFYMGEELKDIKRSFATACDSAGIKDFTFHDLRHTFASWLVMRGVDLRTVMELLGHKSLKMVLRYAHLAPDHKSKAVQILDRKPRKVGKGG